MKKTNNQITKKTQGETASEIIKLWGSGTGGTTMIIHIKKTMYTKLGWDINDIVQLHPDYDNGTLFVRKIKTSSSSTS